MLCAGLFLCGRAILVQGLVWSEPQQRLVGTMYRLLQARSYWMEVHEACIARVTIIIMLGKDPPIWTSRAHTHTAVFEVTITHTYTPQHGFGFGQQAPFLRKKCEGQL